MLRLLSSLLSAAVNFSICGVCCIYSTVIKLTFVLYRKPETS